MQLTGKAFISLNGERIRSKEGASLDMGGTKREASVSDAGVDGFTESNAVPRIECKVQHQANMSLQDFQNFRDGVVVFETDTGKVFTLSPAWNAVPPKMAKGEVDLVFEGVEVLEG